MSHNKELYKLRQRMSDLKLNLSRLAKRQERQADEMTPKQTYECKICWNINHFRHFHCSTCGVIPTMYSIARKPIIFNEENEYREVIVASGCERQVTRRTIKRTARTVPMDYYATESRNEPRTVLRTAGKDSAK